MGKPKKVKPWTDKHTEEAIVRALELCVEAFKKRGALFSFSRPLCTSEASTRSQFAWVLACSCDDPRIDKEICRVRGLAEGRLVRVTVTEHRIVSERGLPVSICTDLAKHRETLATIREDGDREQHVRVTRIKRAR